MKSFLEWINDNNLSLNEAGFARIRQMLLGDVEGINSIGILTSANPQGQKVSRSENESHMVELQDKLREMGYGPIRVAGHFGYPEPSYIVPNITRDETLELGQEFDQASVIWGDKFVDKHGNNNMKFEYISCNTGETESTRIVSLSGEGVQKRSDFYTQAKGRRFIIPFFDDPESKSLFGPSKSRFERYPEKEAEDLHSQS